MKTYYLSRSTRKNKKFMIKSEGKKTIHFGDTRYSDYTIHKDEDRKNRYLIRHRMREDWANPQTSGFWAYHLLWHKPTISEAIQSLKRKGISVINIQ